ncbi:HAD family hydrolase [Sciscionella sediminilitoris]|uniref:HAD family hydrolase n=1 Tax=Sciscionella sediminilitoris TaxID=1445613 RepID=UPI0009E6C9FC|nr:beta-phosphoglucomutase family hydrolase [Sciscionella sp. SE31]
MKRGDDELALSREQAATPHGKFGLPGTVAAVLFDLDGVLTDTAAVHRAAWRRIFDDLVRRREGPAARPFTDEEYARLVDGRSREDGVRAFLAERGIKLPEGTKADDPREQTVQGVAAAKNHRLRTELENGGVRAYPGSVRFLSAVRRAGLRVGVVSASANATEVLAAAGLSALAPVVVDGLVIEHQGLAGKPAPDSFLAGAAALQTEPEHAAVFEDALAGVAAGHAGGFVPVVGVNRSGQAAALREQGADMVVSDLADLLEGSGD